MVTEVVDTLKNYTKHSPANAHLTWKRVLIRRCVNIESKKRFAKLLESGPPSASFKPLWEKWIQGDVDMLFNRIAATDKLGPDDKAEADFVLLLFFEGCWPSPYGLSCLEKVFSPKLIRTIRKKQAEFEAVQD